jgi:radical SAM protein with 4Fe4S-binding SPASM domain
MTKLFVPAAPFQVVWNVTRQCNLHCKHCYENAGRRERNELTIDEALACIDMLAREGVVFLAFSGGEPTLRSDILLLIERAASHGMYVAIATNGLTFADREKVRLFKDAGVSFVQISLDGCNPETHDFFRGLPGAFRRTLKGIENCTSEGLFVEVAMTATHHNLKEVNPTISLANSLGARWFMLYNFVPTGRGQQIVDTDLSPSEREELLGNLWKRISTQDESCAMEVLSTAPQLGRVARQTAQESISGEAMSIFPTHFSNTRLPERMKVLASFIGGCGAGRFYLAIEPNGDIYPCVFFPHESKVLLGNVKTTDFERMWTQSRVLSELRNRGLLQGYCGSCENRDVCGGCCARAIGYFGDYLEPDPGCINNYDAWTVLVHGSKHLQPMHTQHPEIYTIKSDRMRGSA